SLLPRTLLRTNLVFRFQESSPLPCCGWWANLGGYPLVCAPTMFGKFLCRNSCRCNWLQNLQCIIHGQLSPSFRILSNCCITFCFASMSSDLVSSVIFVLFKPSVL